METVLKKRLGIGIVMMVAAILALGGGFFIQRTAVANASESAEAAMVPVDFNYLAKNARSGVVNIRTVKTIKGGGPVFRHFFSTPRNQRNPFEDFFGPFLQGQPRDFKQRSLGSGFIIDTDGYIVTNNHVVDGADEITVRLANEKEYDAEVVGRDPNTDLALIRIKDADDLVPLKMGDSDNLKIGNWVVAIGSPFGLEQTVTAGIVSAKGRIIGSGPYDDFIQTDASINPGNSGGPLLNLKGEVVGINTAIIAQGQGIGFAIPVNMAKEIVAQLKESGSVTRGWIGVGIQDLNDELREYYKLGDREGVLVSQVFEGDPAAEAGIKPQDVIIAVDGKPVKTSRDLSRTIATVPVGNEVEITVLRDGHEKDIDVEVAKRKDENLADTAGPGESEGLGIQVGELTPETARRFGYSADDKGVLVLGVKPGSLADENDIRVGDLIKEVDHTPIDSVRSLRKAVDKKELKGTMLLVKRPRFGMIVIKIS